MHKTLGIAGIIIVLTFGAYLLWYATNRQEKIGASAHCHPQAVMMTAPDGSRVPVHQLEPCMTIVVPPSLWDLVHGRMAFGGVPDRMVVNPYSFTDVLLARYTFGPKDLGCDQSATTTDCASLPRH